LVVEVVVEFVGRFAVELKFESESIPSVIGSEAAPRRLLCDPTKLLTAWPVSGKISKAFPGGSTG
jgi:hypothetical protein